MLKQHKLLIDQDCPMCRAYGQCFTNLNLVDSHTLAPYQTIDDQYAERINMNRAKNEIALFDEESQSTVYGYDALVSIITQRSSFGKRILNSRPIKWIFTQLYFFISYNRKIMVPARPTSTARLCVPDEQPFYRWLYIIFVALTTGYILNHFVYLISAEIGQSVEPYREYIVCISQVIWQFIVISLIEPKKRLEYLGNMSTVSMIGGILLIPLLLINSISTLPIFIFMVSFCAIVIFMLFEHIRRCKILDLPLTMTYTWAIFRVTVLFVILIISL